MPCYLWHCDADGLPLERIGSLTREHVQVITGGLEGCHSHQDGGRPIACSIPKVSEVEWDFVGQGDACKD